MQNYYQGVVKSNEK